MSKTMKAAVLQGVNHLVYQDVPIPELGADDVLVKVIACGVCGSDIPRVLKTGTYHFPTIPGHEFGGEIVELGANVDENLLGKRAAVIPLIPCRSCKMCEVGKFAQCEKYDFLGSRSDGGFAEYVKVPAKNVVIVPDDVDEDSVAFLEPISVALHVVQNCDVKYGDVVAVYGLGAIGIFVAQWAKIYGASKVLAIDIDPDKLNVAKELGLIPINSKTQDVKVLVKEITGGNGVDKVFEASGAPAVFNEALHILGQSGVLGLLGRPGKPLEIADDSFEKLLRNQLTIKGTWSFEFTSFPKHAWELSLEALKTGAIKTAPIISHRLPLSKTYEATKIMADRSEPFYKILIKPQLDT